MPLRKGVRLAVDWGRARVGVAACDRDAILAYPVETVAQDTRTLDRLAALVAEYEPLEVLLGLPIDLAGADGVAAQAMREVAGSLAARFDPVPVCLVDERMSTAAAHRTLRDAGRNSRKRRAVVDQAAAVAILEQALAVEQRTGRPAGERVVPGAEPGT